MDPIHDILGQIADLIVDRYDWADHDTITDFEPTSEEEEEIRTLFGELIDNQEGTPSYENAVEAIHRIIH